MDYGEIFKKQLEKARKEVESGNARNRFRPVYDTELAVKAVVDMVDQLAKAGAPVTTKGLSKNVYGECSLVLTIGQAEYAVTIVNSTIKIHWRGPEHIPMLYDCLSASRMKVLAKGIVERAVSAALPDDVQEEETDTQDRSIISLVK